MSLNDPQWGRGAPSEDEKAKQNTRPQESDSTSNSDSSNSDNEADRRSNSSTRATSNDKDSRSRNHEADKRDELDDLWKNFSEVLQGLMGDDKQKGGARKPKRGEGLRGRDDFSRDDLDPNAPTRDSGNDHEAERKAFGGPLMTIRLPQRKDGGNGRRSSGGGGFGGVLAMLFVGIVAWSASGFYIVPEGQTGVVTTFGKYSESTMPGLHWHLPNPVQSVELVDVSGVRTANIGGTKTVNGIQEAQMLTDDENIVDVQFTVQYRIKPGDGAKDYLFNSRDPDETVTQAAQSAMREVVGRKTMDSVLFESKAEIADQVRQIMQQMLDRYKAGIDVMSVAIQNAQPPAQVQAAFNDAVKAGQDRERSINLGVAYQNAVLPKATGAAARLTEEAQAYKSRVVEAALGDADRFNAVLAQYKKAPKVVRDRMYIDTMKDIYASVTKVVVDQKQGSNLLYLPLDKIVSQTKSEAMKDAQNSLDAVSDATKAATTPVPANPTTQTTRRIVDDNPRDIIANRLR